MNLTVDKNSLELFDIEEDVFEDDDGCYNSSIFKNTVQFQSYTEVTFCDIFCACICSKDHVYRMVIVEGSCTMARSSSFRSKLFIG